MMHDGIVKFSTEYNGVFLHGVNMETYEPIFLPYRLQKMRGGVNAYDLVDAIFDTCAKVMNVKDNAFDCIKSYLSDNTDDELEMEVPPTYFKMGKMKDVDVCLKAINIEITETPVGNCGDGVSVNNKASWLLHILY